MQHLASVMKEKGHERKRSQASRKEKVASVMKEKIPANCIVAVSI